MKKAIYITIGLSILFMLIIASVREFSRPKPANTLLAGHLTVDDEIVNAYKVGAYTINVFESQITIVLDSTKRVVLSTPKDLAFVMVGKGRMSSKEYRGSYYMKDELIAYYKNQSIDEIAVQGDTSILLYGVLTNANEQVSYQLQVKDRKGRLNWTIDCQDKVDRLYLNLDGKEDEVIMGMGSQFSHVNLKGQLLPCFVSEQGIGRGDEPVTTLVNAYAHSGGADFTSYNVLPWYATSQGLGVSINNTNYSTFDFRNANLHQVEIFDHRVNIDFYVGSSLLNVINQYNKDYLMPDPPSWSQGGLILGVQGGTDSVVAKYERLKEAGTPIGGLWIQDWVGQRTTTFGQQLWWNWSLDTIRYHSFDMLLDKMRADSVKLLGYINPFLVEVPSGSQACKRLLYEEAQANDFLLKEKNGNEVKITNTSFTAGLIDLTNPDARSWLANIIQEELVDLGFDGWMADFGEACPLEGDFYEGDGMAIHNLYPVLWAEVNHQVRMNNPGKNLWYFMRAGFQGSQPMTTAYWLGDQNVNWGQHDGIKSAVTGLITANTSGQVFNHSDIGGYTTLTQFPLNITRSEELLARWTELNAFTPFFRSHEGNIPTANAQLYSNENMINQVSKFSSIFQHLSTYRATLIDQYHLEGTPLIIHPYLLYPEVEEFAQYTYQSFFLGPDIYVHPVLDPGVNKVSLYIPSGHWSHLWSGEAIQGDTITTVEAPLGEPPVFIKKGSQAESLLDFVKEL